MKIWDIMHWIVGDGAWEYYWAASASDPLLRGRYQEYKRTICILQTPQLVFVRSTFCSPQQFRICSHWKVDVLNGAQKTTHRRYMTTFRAFPKALMSLSHWISSSYRTNTCTSNCLSFFLFLSIQLFSLFLHSPRPQLKSVNTSLLCHFFLQQAINHPVSSRLRL